MPESATAPVAGRAGWLLALALALAASLLLPAIDVPLRSAESRWLVVAREMVRSNDGLSMTLDGVTYADKPYGGYWLVILSAKLLGGFSEAAGRLPGVLAYLATLVVTYVLGCRTLGARVGALAALLLAVSGRLLVLADTTSADPQQLLGATLAMLLLLELAESGRLRDFALLGAVAGLTTQMKGLPGLALPAFAALLWTLLVRGPRWLSVRGVALGVLIGLAVAGAPYLVARGLHGDWGALWMLWHESVVRAVDPFDHVLPWWFYLVNQFELLLAWSALLPAALLQAGARLRPPAGDERAWWVRLRESEPLRRAAFPLFAYLAVLLFFSLSGSRRSYYLMPIAPFAALLVADVLLAAPARAAAIARRAGLALIGLIGASLGLLALGVGTLRLWSEVPPALLLEREPASAWLWPAVPPWVLAAGLGLVPATALLRARLTPPMLQAAVVATLAQLALCIAVVLMEVRASNDPLPRFVAAVRSIAPLEAVANADDADSSRLLYYLDPPLEREATPRFRIASRQHAESLLAADSEWIRARSPLLDAAAWPPDRSDGYVLLERRPGR